MGFLDSLKAKKDELESQKRKQAGGQPEGKYSQPCALCGGSGTEKKWMGQYWHKKCIRATKKMGRKMI